MTNVPPQFRQGVFVVKVGPTGRLLKRTVHLGLKPEYLELTSKNFFDVGFHITDILNVTIQLGTDSRDFEEFFKSLDEGGPRPKEEKSIVIFTPNKTVSLVFEYVDDRRDFMLLLLYEIKAAQTRYEHVRQKFAAHEVEDAADEAESAV
ncbi:MAG: hypothetical protein KVP17_002029 [Porospora cf. gigantea B]|uniref:uncharacterized protein n=1 Tax=Porospora cf. gigantea B TaxID=2853592 RepID=UPI003571D05B|nr:MAG: hypothetical protein KVP17_002029 [Porospora cf. gigantea B]